MPTTQKIGAESELRYPVMLRDSEQLQERG